MIDTKLGKIELIKFGLGGYSDSMFGLHITFSGTGWGVTDTISTWDYELVKHSEYCKWDEQERTDFNIQMIKRISKLLKDAKVQTIDQLKGKPVEIVFEGNTLKTWRILTEVL